MTSSSVLVTRLLKKKLSQTQKPLIIKQICFYKYSLRVSINTFIIKGSYYEIFNKNLLFHYQLCVPFVYFVHLDDELIGRNM